MQYNWDLPQEYFFFPLYPLTGLDSIKHLSLIKPDPEIQTGIQFQLPQIQKGQAEMGKP